MAHHLYQFIHIQRAVWGVWITFAPFLEFAYHIFDLVSLQQLRSKAHIFYASAIRLVTGYAVFLVHLFAYITRRESLHHVPSCRIYLTPKKRTVQEQADISRSFHGYRLDFEIIHDREYLKFTIYTFACKYTLENLIGTLAGKFLFCYIYTK